MSMDSGTTAMTTSDDVPKPKRKWWRWAIVVALLAVAFIIKAKINAAEERRRFEAWKKEVEAKEIYVSGVSYSGHLIFDWIPGLADYLGRNKAAVSIPSDDVAEILLNLQSPSPAGLFLIDAGMSPDVARRLREKYPLASFPVMPKGAIPPAASNQTRPRSK